MNDPAPASVPVSVRPPWWLRLLRSLLILFLGVSLTALMALTLAGYLPVVVHRLGSDQGLEGAAKAAVVALAGLLFLTPLVVLAVAGRRGMLTWRNLVLLALPAAVLLVWLAYDEPVIKYPLTVAEFAPEFPGADQSYAVLMRYSKQAPTEEAAAFAKKQWTVANAGWASLKEADRRLEFVAKHRAALEADWAALAPQRSWVDELNAFDRIGDLTPASSRANIMTFAVWRAYSQQACAMALLQVSDGQGDAAIATVLPVLECGRKLQRDSRTLVRSMIGIVMERMALETAGTVLERAAVSPALRERLGEAVARDNPRADARRLVLIEYAVFTPALLREVRAGELVSPLDARWKWLRGVLQGCGALIINRNATANLIGENAFAVADFAEAREIAKIDARGKQLEEQFWRSPGVKNLGGRLLLVMSTPAYGRVVESCWKTADLRAGLRQRLATDATAAKTAAN